MKNLVSFLLLFALFAACSSDDEACETQEPIEINEGEGRIGITWQDVTSGRKVTAYEFQLVLRGEQPSNSFGRETTPIITAPDNNRLFIQSYRSLPYDTEFDLYYRVDCGGNLGETLGPIALRSLAFGEGCTAPRDFELIELTETTVTVQWEGFDESLWRLGWGANDGQDSGDVEVTETSYTITDLRPGITYLIGVAALCTGTDYSLSQLDLNPTLSVTTLED